MDGENSRERARDKPGRWKSRHNGRAGRIFLFSLLGGFLALLSFLPFAFIFLEPRTRPDPPALRLKETLFLTDRYGAPLRGMTDEKWARHLWAGLDEIPDTVRKAFLAAEDERFNVHPGFDPLAILRAATANIRAGRVVSGASTITQQLVKSARPGPRSAKAKLLEIVEAARLERILSKDEILTLYLNRVDLANNIFGVEAAARCYFGKKTRDLDPAEAAVLASLPKAPARFDPWGPRRKELLERRNWVLLRMGELGFISKVEAAQWKKRPLGVISADLPHNAPHLTEFLASTGRLGQKIGEVRLTLDMSAQRMLEEVLASNRRRLEYSGASQACGVIIDNRTMGVLALAGSYSYEQHAQGFVNGVLARRSAGSALKPFLYALAMEKGYSPASIVDDVEQSFKSDEGEYLPLNYDRQSHGPVNFRMALGKSLNLPAVRLLDQIGQQNLYGLFRELNLLPDNAPGPEHYGLGLAVGNPEVRLLDIAAAYAALANGGLYAPPRFLMNDPEPKPRRLISTEAAFLVTDILSDPLVRSTAFSKFPPPQPVALKTGTSTHYRDGWTVGYTPRFTVGVWVGNFDGRGTGNLFGGEGAGRIFTDLMRAIYPGEPPPSFPKPDTIFQTVICSQSGLIPGPGCKEMKMEYFVKGSEPRHSCDLHQSEGAHDLPARFATWLKKRHEEGRESRYRLAGLNRDLTALFVPSAPEAPVPYSGTVHVGGEGSPFSAPETDLHIVYPLEGDRYVLPPGEQTLSLRLEAALQWPVESVEWFIDGVAFARTGPPYSTRLDVGRGKHRIQAVDSHGFGRSIEISVE